MLGKDKSMLFLKENFIAHFSQFDITKITKHKHFWAESQEFEKLGCICLVNKSTGRNEAEKKIYFCISIMSKGFRQVLGIFEKFFTSNCR